MELDDKSLQILSCDISIRPRGAAGIADLAPHIQSIETGNGAVTVHLNASGMAAAQSFVSAEKMCCTSLYWDLSESAGGDGVTMVIHGTPEQVSLIQQWFGD